MPVTIQLPSVLRDLAGGRDLWDVEAESVTQALQQLMAHAPALRRHLYTDDGRLRSYVNVFVNQDELRTLPRGVDTPLRQGDSILIVPSIAGGEEDDRLSTAELARYSRHLALPEVGREGQERLRRARVLVTGAGGLGSPVTLYLAAAGVGTLGIVEFDEVDLTNLQRQVLYATSDVGRPKIDAAVERLHGINPHVKIVPHAVRLTSANALEILRDYDVVVDGTDNFPTRYLLNDACVLLGKPFVYGSIFRFEGQVSVFDARTGPCYRCIFREPPPPGLVPNCAEGGVLGVLPGIVGSVQALEVIKLIIGKGTSLVGRLALFDAMAFRWRELRLSRHAQCPMCGEAPSITGLIDYDEFCARGADEMNNPAAGQTPEITVTELKQKLDAGEDVYLLDVREPFEWDIANLGEYGATLLPLGDVPDRVDEIDRDRDLVVYCRSGSRSAGAVRFLRAQGFERVSNLKGGVKAWSEEIDPSMPSY
jgi:sulfur-carrier protein adenylyltransferase/sulfurtransferase